MKAFRLLMLVLVAGLAATIARADAIDPKITIGGGGSCEGQSLTSLTQSFTGLTTGCLIDFTNKIPNGELGGITLFQIVVNITSPFEGPLSCIIGTGSPFTLGVVSSPSSCTFSVPELQVEGGGVPPNGVFSLTFDTNFGPTVDATLSQTVITPEPASGMLLLAGAGALAAFRKRRQARA